MQLTNGRVFQQVTECKPWDGKLTNGTSLKLWRQWKNDPSSVHRDTAQVLGTVTDCDLYLPGMPSAGPEHTFPLRLTTAIQAPCTASLWAFETEAGTWSAVEDDGTATKSRTPTCGAAAWVNIGEHFASEQIALVAGGWSGASGGECQAWPQGAGAPSGFWDTGQICADAIERCDTSVCETT